MVISWVEVTVLVVITGAAVVVMAGAELLDGR